MPAAAAGVGLAARCCTASLSPGQWPHKSLSLRTRRALFPWIVSLTVYTLSRAVETIVLPI